MVGTALALLCCAAAAADGSIPGRAFPARDTADGISCRFFDVALGLAWPGSDEPTWTDAAGRLGGSRPYDTEVIEAGKAPALLRWDVLALVRAWGRGELPNHGLIVAALGAHGGEAEFHSRESPDIGARPSLRVVHGDGSSELLSPAADAALDCSTYVGRGALPAIRIGPRSKGFFRFDLARLRKGSAADAKAAELILLRVGTSSPAPGPLGVFRPATPWDQSFAPAPPGIATRHPGDRGIEKDPAVLFADKFDGGKLDGGWNANEIVRSRVVDGNPARDGAAPDGPSLRVTIARGDNLGLDLRYDFLAHQHGEPEEVYLRYYLRVAREWMDTPDSGKLPGLAGTYGKVGWGGRPWDGRQGWSARGSFLKAVGPDHPAAGRLVLASYVYHGKAPSAYGDIFTWSGSNGAAFLEPERWYCIEQHVRLNTPGRDDGVLRAWVDGRPVFEKRDLRLRDLAAIRIESAWFNVYMGGRTAARQDMALWIDNVVIARRYIGPIAR